MLGEMEEDIRRQCKAAGVFVINGEEDIRRIKREAIELATTTPNSYASSLALIIQAMRPSVQQATLIFENHQIALPDNWEKPKRKKKHWKDKTIWDRVN